MEGGWRALVLQQGKTQAGEAVVLPSLLSVSCDHTHLLISRETWGSPVERSKAIVPIAMQDDHDPAKKTIALSDSCRRRYSGRLVILGPPSRDDRPEGDGRNFASASGCAREPAPRIP